MTGPTARAVGPRRRRRVFILLGLLLLLMAYVGVDVWAGHRVDVEVARLEAVYGSLEASRPTPVPAADNRARVVRAAAAMVVLNADLGSVEFSSAFARFTRLAPPAPVPANLRAFVEANHVAIGLADQIRTRHRSDFEVDYPSAGNLPLLDMRTLSSVLYLAAILDLEAGRADDASTKITSGLAVAASLRQEPDLIAQLVRIGIAQQQLQAVQRVLTEAEPSKAALAELARWLTEGRAPDPMHAGLLGELRNVNTGFFDASGPRFGPLARLGRPWIRLARVRYLQQMGDLLDIQSGPRPRPAPAVSTPPPAWALLDRLAAISLPGLLRAIETGDDFKSECGATELAVALRRHRLDRGVYPNDLAALTPAYLDRLPIDPYTGQPAVYAHTASGFALRAQAGPHATPVKRPTFEWDVSK